MDMLEEEDSEEAINSHIENIGELVNALTAWRGENPDKEGLSAFLEEIALASDVDKIWNKSEDTVNCMTLHCAKGWNLKPCIFVRREEDIPFLRVKISTTKQK